MLTRNHPFVVNLVVAKVARTRERPFLTAAVSAAMTRANRRQRFPVGTTRSNYWPYPMR